MSSSQEYQFKHFYYRKCPPRARYFIFCFKTGNNYGLTAYYGHLIITDSLLCPWGKKALTFSLNSTRLIRHLIITDSLLCPWRKKALTFSLNSTSLIQTPYYYRQFALSLEKKSPYFFSKFNQLNTDTLLLQTVCFFPRERKPLLFL